MMGKFPDNLYDLYIIFDILMEDDSQYILGLESTDLHVFGLFT